MCKGCHSSNTGAVDEMGEYRERTSAGFLWGMEASRIYFLLRATYDVLPSPAVAE